MSVGVMPGRGGHTPGTWRGFRARGWCVTRAPSRLCWLCPLGACFGTPRHRCRWVAWPVVWRPLGGTRGLAAAGGAGGLRGCGIPAAP